MKLRAIVLAVLALACLSAEAQAQRPSSRSRTGSAVPVYGAYQRSKLLSVRGRAASEHLGSVSRRALLTTGRLPAAAVKRTTRSTRR